MSFTLQIKAELEIWAAALKAYDEEDFEKALDLFSRIDDSSKILTNMGLIYAMLGEHEAAVEKFLEATSLDTYLAVAYFQCGVSNFLLERYELAYKDFEEALLYMRGQQVINYEQLGLKFTLFSAEVLFNLGLCLISLGRVEEGLAKMEEAKRVKATEEHNIIDDAIHYRGEGFTVWSIPKGVLYRPSEKTILSSKAKDYMGKINLIAASNSRDSPVRSEGNDRLQQGITPTVTSGGGKESDATGEHSDPPHELTKVRVKLHYAEDVRGLGLKPETPFEEFMDRVTAKFDKEINGLVLEFKDEAGRKMSLRDESDWELAIQTARERAKGKPEGKLEIWCTDA